MSIRLATWDCAEAGKRIVMVADTDHLTRGSYGLDTEQETKAAEDEELAKLESGEWVVVGFGLEEQCNCCDAWKVTDAIWGCVIENSEEIQKREAGWNLGVEVAA